MPCPLCHFSDTQHYHQDKKRHYFQCQRCHLVFADPASLLPPNAEKHQYDQHQNTPQDPGYRRFLNRLAAPVAQRMTPASHGLDFGCGPGPTLSLMFEEAGHPMAVYDPYFFPDRAPLRRQYDFVTCTEAIEHFYRPGREWQLLLSLVKPGGTLGIMTKLVRDADAFASWHYKNDPTHVSFFSRLTFRYLAEQDNLQIEFIGNDVILLQKPA